MLTLLLRQGLLLRKGLFPIDRMGLLTGVLILFERDVLIAKPIFHRKYQHRRCESFAVRAVRNAVLSFKELGAVLHFPQCVMTLMLRIAKIM